MITSVKSISVVIPNYNGRSLLEANLPPLLQALEHSGVDYEIIISDDCSTDNSVDFLKQEYPEIKLLEAGQNGGFATNINRGIVAAGKELVLILNSDIVLPEDFFTGQFAYFENDEHCFGVMPRILTADGQHTLDTGKFARLKLWFIKSTRNYRVNYAERPHFTFYLSGACALIERQKLQLLGGFNEAYSPFYGEDVDLSLRAWGLGYNCYYHDEVTCRHAISSTIKKSHQRSYVKQIIARNKFLTPYMHMQGVHFALWVTIVVLNLLTRFLVFDFKYYQGVFGFLRRMHINRLARSSWRRLWLNEDRRQTIFEIVKKINANLASNQVSRF